MATKEQAIINAKFMLRMYRNKEFIYRVGRAWMNTNRSLESIQAEYKWTIIDYQEIRLENE